VLLVLTSKNGLFRWSSMCHASGLGAGGRLESASPDMEKKEPGPKTRARYREIGERLAGKGVVSSQMFGVPSLKAGGKAFAGLHADSMVFKLPPGPHAEALKLKGATLFDPSEMGRPDEGVGRAVSRVRQTLAGGHRARPRVRRRLTLRVSVARARLRE
jgi:hypothetical protein